MLSNMINIGFLKRKFHFFLETISNKKVIELTDYACYRRFFLVTTCA
ncbi:hypothetical protein DB41_CV00150 [Neochlamydia sp. TUME1]|nr:hypothetical protein DB41_CV00150 [Neochlamydia sp. TUME1]